MLVFMPEIKILLGILAFYLGFKYLEFGEKKAVEYFYREQLNPEEDTGITKSSACVCGVQH